MPRYSDIGVALNELEHTTFYDKRDYETAKEMIKTMPTADVVEVVRCKDCKYRDDDGMCFGRGVPLQLVPDDGFCDKGERREDAG